MSKRCPKCNTVKPLSEFHRDKARHVVFHHIVNHVKGKEIGRDTIKISKKNMQEVKNGEKIIGKKIVYGTLSGGRLILKKLKKYNSDFVRVTKNNLSKRHLHEREKEKQKSFNYLGADVKDVDIKNVLRHLTFTTLIRKKNINVIG